MAEAIVDGRGSGNYVGVNEASRMLVQTEGISVSGVSVFTGSEVWIKGGSVSVYDTVQTAGSIWSMPNVTIGSVHAVVDSVYVQSGDNINLGTAWTDIGSVHVSNPLEVSGPIFVNGDMTGSFHPAGTGSVVIKSAPLLGVSGAIFDSGDITGSMVISSSNRLGVSGEVNVINTVQTAGSIWSMPTLTIGSVHATVDSVYVQSGNITVLEQIPTDSSLNNPSWRFDYITSGTSSGVTGSGIGSIYQFIGTGSYTQSLTYKDNFLTEISAWVVM